ncbi:hypothetical protein JTB14_036259 [Gonioctena quinquepunctata]|nr:hypothetical protein JTB14_036259 [Gonioctena quinquepunctata]
MEVTGFGSSNIQVVILHVFISIVVASSLGKKLQHQEKPYLDLEPQVLYHFNQIPFLIMLPNQIKKTHFTSGMRQFSKTLQNIDDAAQVHQNIQG